MKTKYVRAHSGLFAIFSEGLGLQHTSMADHMADARSMGDAGFVDLIDGRFCVYGESITLGIRSSKKAEEDMNGALERGELRIYPYGEVGAIATNAHLPGKFEIVGDVGELRKRRIFTE